MAASHGTKAVFKVDNAGGTLTDISDYISSSGLDETIDTAEVTTLGGGDTDGAKSFIAGLGSATVPIEGPYDPTVDALLDGIKRLTRDAQYFPVGEGSGSPQYDFQVILTSKGIATGIDDAARITGAFQVTGAITRSTV